MKYFEYDKINLKNVKNKYIIPTNIDRMEE